MHGTVGSRRSKLLSMHMWLSGIRLCYFKLVSDVILMKYKYVFERFVGFVGID